MKDEKKITPVKTTTAAPLAKNVTATKPIQTPMHRTNVTSTAAILAPNKNIKANLFGKENYKWMLIGLVVMALGFFLMAGGKSSNPNVFTDEDVYSTTRITIAPILIIAGLLIEIFAIMRKSKTVV